MACCLAVLQCRQHRDDWLRIGQDFAPLREKRNFARASLWVAVGDLHVGISRGRAKGIVDVEPCLRRFGTIFNYYSTTIFIQLQGLLVQKHLERNIDELQSRLEALTA